MFEIRLRSGVILVAVALITIILGGPVLLITLLAISLIGQMEFYRIFKIEKESLGVVGYVAAMIYYLLLYGNATSHIVEWLVLFFLSVMAVYVIFYPSVNVEQTMASIFGVIYVPVMLSYIYQVRDLKTGLYLAGLVFISSWGCDTCAYCIGVKFGRHKMTPKLSPKKSIEGAIGGLLGAEIIGFLYGVILAERLELFNSSAIACGVICFFGGALSMVGDLAASAIKRNHNIKDYGNLIPGHGGVLDRFDSLIFTAPVIFYLIKFF